MHYAWYTDVFMPTKLLYLLISYQSRSLSKKLVQAFKQKFNCRALGSRRGGRCMVSNVLLLCHWSHQAWQAESSAARRPLGHITSRSGYKCLSGDDSTDNTSHMLLSQAAAECMILQPNPSFRYTPSICLKSVTTAKKWSRAPLAMLNNTVIAHGSVTTHRFKEDVFW